MFNAIIIHQNKNKIFKQILISWAENREWMYRVFIKYCVFSKDFKIFQTLASRCQCVYTHQAGRTQALQQNWQSSEKSQNLKEKTQYLTPCTYFRVVEGWSFPERKPPHMEEAMPIDIRQFQIGSHLPPLLIRKKTRVSNNGI